MTAKCKHLKLPSVRKHKQNFFFFNEVIPMCFRLRILRVSSVKTQLIYCQLKWRHVLTHRVIIRPIIEPCFRYIKWKCTFLGSQNVYNSNRMWIQMRFICIHVLLLLQKFWDPKNVHFHLMYLKHGSIIGLMMTLWVETCRHFDNILVVFWLNLLLEFLTKRTP